jgi:acetyl-CoA C-acetyltransferase
MGLAFPLVTPSLQPVKINVNGSGISLGHPIAATGAMRLVTLLHEMKRRGSRFGLETICGGGGLGIAAIVERRGFQNGNQ